MRAQSISEPPSNDRRSVEPGLYMLLKCQKAAVRRKLRDRNPDLFSAFEILDHTRSALASHALAAQPKSPSALGADAAPDRPLVASRPHLSSLSPAPHGRYH